MKTRLEISPIILFNIIINDVDGGAEHTLSKFAGYTELGAVADAPEGHAAIQRDLARLEELVDSNLSMHIQGTKKGYTVLKLSFQHAIQKNDNRKTLLLPKVHLN